MRLRDFHAYISVVTTSLHNYEIKLFRCSIIVTMPNSGSELMTNGWRHFGCKSMFESLACCRLRSEKHHRNKSYSLLSACKKTLSNKHVFCRKLAVMLHALVMRK